MGQHGKKMEMGARMKEPLMGPSLQRTEREREKREEMSFVGLVFFCG